jgi:hypothetical protein
MVQQPSIIIKTRNSVMGLVHYFRHVVILSGLLTDCHDLQIEHYIALELMECNLKELVQSWHSQGMLGGQPAHFLTCQVSPTFLPSFPGPLSTVRWCADDVTLRSTLWDRCCAVWATSDGATAVSCIATSRYLTTFAARSARSNAEQVLTLCNVPGCCIKKPENILVDTMKQIKLIDFGIAKELSSNTTANTTGVLSGTATHTHTHTTRHHT